MKKSLIFAGMLVIGFANAQEGNVGINTDQPKATLDIQPNATNLAGTTNQGILAPRLSKTRVANIETPVQGTLVYVLDENSTEYPNSLISAYTGTDAKVAKITEKGYYFYNGTEWVKAGTDAISSAQASKWTNDTVKSLVKLTNLSDGNTVRTDDKNIFINDKGNIGVGSDDIADTAILDLQSTSKGLLIPRMTNQEMMSISNPPKGLMVINTSAGGDLRINIGTTDKPVWATSWNVDAGYRLNSRYAITINNSKADGYFSTGGLFYSGVANSPSHWSYGRNMGIKGGYIISDGGDFKITTFKPVDTVNEEQQPAVEAVANAFVVKNLGNVGIGTNTPSEKLEVAGKIKASSLAQTGAGDRVVYADENGVLKTGVSAAANVKLATANNIECTEANTGTMNFGSVTINGKATEAFGFCMKNSTGEYKWYYIYGGAGITTGSGAFGSNL